MQKELAIELATKQFQQIIWKVSALYPGITSTYQFRKMSLIFNHNPRTSVMGRAWRASSVIELNLAYFESEAELMLNQVIGHEVCHIVAPLLYGDKGNGHTPAWKAVMSSLGFDPTTGYITG